MEVITSLENKKIKNYSKLLQKKYREELFLVSGEHLVTEAYKTSNLKEIILTPDYETTIDVPKTYVTYDIIKKLSTTETPQKIIGVCKKSVPKEIGNKVLILDDLQDPGNLGTIIRSSVSFDIDTIILSNNTVDLYNDKVIRSSEGMLFHINILKQDIFTTIKELKNKNYTVYGTKVDNGLSIKKVTPPDSYAVIIGNEGAGIKKDILSLCDEYLYIPMNNNCESLNAGVATSIILYEFNSKK